MSYYPTLAEDVARAKAILAKGRADSDPDLPPAVRGWLMDHGGGTIYGADIYAAYRLLQSFVEAIECVGPKVCELAMRHQRMASEPHTVSEGGTEADGEYWRKRNAQRIATRDDVKDVYAEGLQTGMQIGKALANGTPIEDKPHFPAHIPGCTCVVVNGEYRSTEINGCPIHEPICPHGKNQKRYGPCGFCEKGIE